jgi:hypothetical protein
MNPVRSTRGQKLRNAYIRKKYLDDNSQNSQNYSYWTSSPQTMSPSTIASWMAPAAAAGAMYAARRRYPHGPRSSPRSSPGSPRSSTSLTTPITYPLTSPSFTDVSRVRHPGSTSSSVAGGTALLLATAAAATLAARKRARAAAAAKKSR